MFAYTGGLKGDDGAAGSQGDQGIQGDAGIQGDQGIQGIQGIQGEAGVAAFVSHFMAYRSADQTIADASFDKVEFNLEQYDDNTEYDKDTNYRWTCKIAGKYHIDSIVPMDALAVGKTSWLVAKLNGTTDIFCGEERPGFGGQIAPSVHGDYEFEVDDYVEIFAFQNSGGGLNTYHNYGNPFFSIHRFK